MRKPTAPRRAPLRPKRQRGRPARGLRISGPATRAATAASRCRVGKPDTPILASLRGAASLALRAQGTLRLASPILASSREAASLALRAQGTLRLAAALLAALLLASPILAQEAEKKDSKKIVAFDGSEVFCYLLQRYNFKPIPTMDEFRAAEPTATLLVLLGDTNQARQLGLSSDMLADFHKQGGNVLVATDYAAQRYLASLGFFVSDVKVFQPPQACYRGIEQCPMLLPDQLPGKHPLFLKANKDQEIEPFAQGIATNAPGQLFPNVFFNLEPLVSYREVPRRQQASGAIYGSAAGSPAVGRVVALAGHGAFMNGMLLQPDNDNFAFAVNCVDWLGETNNQRRRTKALFIFDGKIVDSFDVNLTPPIPPVPMPTAKLINRLLRGLEDERFFHHLLLDGGMGNRIVQFMLALATFALILYAGKKLLETKHSLETGVPLLVGAHAAGPNTAPLAEQRADALLTKNNLWEEARSLSLDWWRRSAPPGLLESAKVLPIAFPNSGWWKRRKLRDSATMVWQFAKRQSPLPVPRKLFLKLMQALADLDDALDDGKLAFVAGDSRRKS